MPALPHEEIRALARIIDELDYYQLMSVPRGASARDVKNAYHAVSRGIHPDANRGLDTDLRRSVERIAMRVTEAYTVLRNPRRREAYDRQLQAVGGLRIQLAEAEAEARRHAETEQGRTPQGRQYQTLARAAAAREDWAAAERNLRTALTFEPGNESFRRQLEEARRKLR